MQAMEPTSQNQSDQQPSPTCKSKAGRPKGAKTVERDVVEVPASTCKRCGSTRRAPYKSAPKSVSGSGIRNGVRYNTVTWRHTSCLDCGQYRVDVTYEMK